MNPSSEPVSEPVSRKLRLDDIADVRAYERERDAFRARVIELKRRRRVHIGTIVTLVFECRDTIRFQVQEMARIERLATDAQIQTELDVYNPLVPEPGELCATMFLELTSDEQMREWLPKLAGVERSVFIRLDDGTRLPGRLDEGHAEGLTRDAVTAAVHYLRWELSPDQVAGFAAGRVRIEIDHPAYRESVGVGDTTHAELVDDLNG